MKHPEFCGQRSAERSAHRWCGGTKRACQKIRPLKINHFLLDQFGVYLQDGSAAAAASLLKDDGRRTMDGLALHGV